MNIGTIIHNRYELISEIGQGGMGVVFRAHDNTLKRDVAVKVLSNIHLDPKSRELLLREAQVTANLNHPNIVTVYDAGEFEETPFIVMELVEGQTLRENPPEDMQGVIAISCQIAHALKHAHEHHLIHRDMKPENVALAVDGTAKLMDFGLARSMTSRMTDEGLIQGTVFYMAPEQAMGKQFDARVDLYAFGVMLYELATGEIPFSADDPVAIISQHLHAPVVPPRARQENIPPVLNDLILQLLRKNPDERPSTAQEVLNVLESPAILEMDIVPSERLSVLDRIVRGRMVGRKEELNEARALWNRVREGEGHLLFISGEAGVGKTRLMREIATQVEISGGEVLVGECRSERIAPYTPFMQIIRRALRKYVDIANDLPDPVFADLLSLVPELCSDYPHIKANPELDPETEQRRLFENMVKFITILCNRSPILFVIEDIHWADSNSLYLLQLLARRMRKQPLMLLSTFREIEQEENKLLQEILLDLSRKRLGTTLKLDRLSQDDTRDLVSTIFDDEITPEISETISQETEGNPFFIEEICKVLIDTGEITRDNGQWSRPKEKEGLPLPVPKGAMAAIQSRVNKLADETQDILLFASVIGRNFDYEILKPVTEKDEDVLINSLEEALNAQLVEEIPEMHGELFSFSHAMIPAVIRESVSGLRRTRMHRKVALAIEDLRSDAYEPLAYHWEEAGDDERALLYAVKSAERARQSFANAEALRYVEKALELTKEADLDGCFRLLMTRESINDLLGNRDEQREDLSVCEDLAERLSNDEKRAEVALRKARLAVSIDDYEVAIDLAQEAISIAQDAGATECEASGYLTWGRVLMRQGNFPDSQVQIEKALSLAKSSQLDKLEAECLNALGVIGIRQSDFTMARSSFEESLVTSREIGDQHGECKTLNNLGMIASYQGDYKNARMYFEKALVSFREMGDRNAESVILINLGYLDLNLKEFKSARPYFEQALDLVREMENRFGESTVYLNLGVISAVEGDYTNARTSYEKALTIFREIGDKSGECMVFNNLGELALEQGDFIEAQRLFDEALDLSQEVGEHRAEYLALSNLTFLATYLGNFDEAQEFCESAMDVFQKFELDEFKGVALTCKGYVLQEMGRYREAFDFYKRALTTARDMGKDYETVDPLAGLAATKLAQQDLDQALKYVEEILAFMDTHVLYANNDISIYLACYRVLQALNDPRGDELLRTAHSLLQKRSASISDEGLRNSFLEKIPHNRDILAAYEEKFGSFTS